MTRIRAFRTPRALSVALMLAGLWALLPSPPVLAVVRSRPATHRVQATSAQPVPAILSGVAVPGHSESGLVRPALPRSRRALTSPQRVAPVPLQVRPYSGEAVVLLYHHLSPEPEGASTIAPTQFRADMEYLKQTGFNVVSMDTLCRSLEGKVALPRKAVAITFDDGYESFYRYAYPVLRDLGFPATMFVIVADTGITAPGGSSPHLTWDEMREMGASGLVTFGSHTYDEHRYVQTDENGAQAPELVARIYDPWTGLRESEEEHLVRVKADLERSKAMIETGLGVTVDTLAFPYGVTSSAVTGIAREVGYKFMFLIKPGIVGPGTDPDGLYRVNAGNPAVTVPLLSQAIARLVGPAASPTAPVYGRSRTTASAPSATQAARPRGVRARQTPVSYSHTTMGTGKEPVGSSLGATQHLPGSVYH